MSYDPAADGENIARYESWLAGTEENELVREYHKALADGDAQHLESIKHEFNRRNLALPSLSDPNDFTGTPDQ